MPATLHVIFGPCGAGKTTYARALAQREGAVPFVLDDWGARLFGPDVQGALDFGWMMERLRRCEALIWSTATDVLAAGAPVILDRGLMRRAERERVRQMAEAAGVSVKWHFVDAPQDARRARIAARNASCAKSRRASHPRALTWSSRLRATLRGPLTSHPRALTWFSALR